MKGIDRVNGEKLFPRSEVTFTRGHRFKVRGGRFNTDIRGTYFTQRVLGAWNALPGRVVEAGTLGTFKTYLDSHMNGVGMVGYKRMV